MRKVFLENNAYSMIGFIFDDGMVMFDCPTFKEATEMDCSGIEGCKTAEEAAVNCNTEVHKFNEEEWEEVIYEEEWEEVILAKTQYILIEVIERKIIVETFDSLRKAQINMRKRVRECADLSDMEEGYDYEISDMSAWITDGHNHDNYDWLIEAV